MSSWNESQATPYFRREVQGDIVILYCLRATLSEEDNVELFGRQLLELVDQQGYRKIIVSLQPVTWVTSSILGKLIHLHRQLQRNQGQLILCDITPSILDVLTTSRLDSYFQITADVNSAVVVFTTATP